MVKTIKTRIMKIMLIILLTFLLFTFSWLSANVESLKSWSVWFFNFGLVSLVLIVASSVYQETVSEDDEERIQVIVYEGGGILDKITDKNTRKYLTIFIYLIVFGLGVRAFTQAKGGFQTLKAPQYAVIGLTREQNAFISGAAGLLENYGLFSVIPSMFGFSLFYFMLGGTKDKGDPKNLIPKVVGTIMFFVVGVFGWVIYHWGRYGSTDITASISVGVFALINLAWVWTMKNIIMCHVQHFFNNIGYSLKGYKIDYIDLMTNPIFIGVFIFIIFIIYLNYKRRK